ncbi:MAG: hypothetical protein AB7T74_07560 [Clostridia bacterium]
MSRIISIVVFVCMATACQAYNREAPQPTVQESSPANAWRPDRKDTAKEPVEPSSTAMQVSAGTLIAEAPAESVEKAAPSSPDLQILADGFMDTRLMRNPSPVIFADLAYSDITLDFIFDGEGRIDQINGVLRDMYDSFTFRIPVVPRGIDAISGSRQVNWEDIIIQLEPARWRVMPVCLQESEPLEVAFGTGIEFREGDTITRVSRDGSVFTCSKVRMGSDGKETVLLSWSIIQYQRGPESVIQVEAEDSGELPLILIWEPGSIAGYIVSLPEGRMELLHRLQWIPSGIPETDRYNFLVLLTQRHGSYLRIPGTFGSVDPVWLALLMYDHVVNP